MRHQGICRALSFCPLSFATERKRTSNQSKLKKFRGRTCKITRPDRSRKTPYIERRASKKPPSGTDVPDRSFSNFQPFICPACSIQLSAPAVPPAVQYKTEEQATTYSPADHVRSTIGAGGLNFRVRHGTGWTPSAIITCSSALSSQRSCSASSFYLLPSSEQN